VTPSHTVGLLFTNDRPIRFTFQSQPHWCPDGGSLGRLARHLSTPPFDITSPTLAVSGGIRRLGAWLGAVPGTASRAVRACGLRSSRARGATARRTRCRSHLEGGVGTRWLGPIGTGPARRSPHRSRRRCLALPPPQRSPAPRARPPTWPVSCRQRPQADPQHGRSPASPVRALL